MDVEALHAHGGGDCPELGMEGISRALVPSRENSHVIVLTDASCKDDVKKNDVIKVAKLLQTKVHFFSVVRDVKMMIFHTIERFNVLQAVFLLTQLKVLIVLHCLLLSLTKKNQNEVFVQKIPLYHYQTIVKILIFLYLQSSLSC